MAAITAALVAQLRERTGLGMMECKKALTETEGDLEAAVELLRKKGVKDRGDRVAGEGIVVAHVGADNKVGVLLELNSETDFVARNEDFQALARTLAMKAADSHAETAEQLLAEAHDDAELADRTLAGAINAAVSRIGERIVLGRFVRFKAAEGGVISSYVHTTSGAGGKIGVLVETTGTNGDPSLGRDVAMHISFAKPKALTDADVDAATLAKEREIITAQTEAQMAGKPEQAKNSAIEGRVRKYLGEIVLMNQPYIRDDKKTVGALVKEQAGAQVTRFARFEVGENVPKEDAAS